ncbi:MAG TPA: AMP-binding protein [Verrucomicrobiae bacterium]
MNVFSTLSDSARRWPKRPAVIDGAGTLDYQSLWREVEALRAQLDGLGLREGQGVGVLAANGRAFIISMLAVLGCGGVMMPLYHQLKRGEIEQMLACAPLAGIVAESSDLLPDGAASRELRLLNGTRLCFSRIAGAAPGAMVPWVQDAAFLRFTSGTTGAAKGVVVTHEGALERIRAANAGLALGCEDRVLWILPMAYHFIVSVVLYLEVGAAIVVCPDHLAETVLETAARHEATFLYAAPMHVRALAADASRRRLPATCRRVLSVSSRLHPQVARDFLARYGVPVAQGYGIIEVGLPVLNLEQAAERPEAIGRPLPGFAAAILDEALKPVGDGQTGQLAVRGPGMFAGYLSPPLAREAVLSDGWFLTGDLAHRDRDGLFTIDGRSKSVINVAGHKVFPEDVAAVLDQHPAVWRSRVTTRPHPRLGEIVHADVQLREGRLPVGTEDLLAFCRRRLSGYKVPASIALVEEIELTPSGKVRHG